jgi:DNA polymerase-3 subunit alpha
MPDIDTDFCIERRDEMIEYVTAKYGEANVAQIITFNRLTSKAVLKDVARVLDIPYAESDKMAKLIPVSRGKPTPLKVMISAQTPEPQFKEKYDNEPHVRKWLDMAIRIEGTNKNFGVHAAGVVISSEPLDEVVPLQKNNDGAVITQYFMEDLESLGLLKMDFLGLKNLTTLKKTAELIKLNKGHDIDLDQLPLEERKAKQIISKGTVKKLPPDIQRTHALLEEGDLEGIFQLESAGMKQIVKDLKPSGIEDISSDSPQNRIVPSSSKARKLFPQATTFITFFNIGAFKSSNPVIPQETIVPSSFKATIQSLPVAICWILFASLGICLRLRLI